MNEISLELHTGLCNLVSIDCRVVGQAIALPFQPPVTDSFFHAEQVCPQWRPLHHGQ